MKISNIRLNRNKKAVSEVISYVLLIVIAISLATGVYVWMRAYVPSETEEKCADDTAISITDYNCIRVPPVNGPRYIDLKVLNQGFFDVDGFFIIASDAVERPPYQGVNSTEVYQIEVGRYNLQLKPGESSLGYITFHYPKYQNGTEWTHIARLKVQPFKTGTKALLACPYIAEIRPEASQGC